MEYPNKIYHFEYKGENSFGNICHFSVAVAASDAEVAKAYVKEKIGLSVEPVWLMDAVYPTIYSQTGNVPEKIQAKILYNSNYTEVKNK